MPWHLVEKLEEKQKSDAIEVALEETEADLWEMVVVSEETEVGLEQTKSHSTKTKEMPGYQTESLEGKIEKRRWSWLWRKRF